MAHDAAATASVSFIEYCPHCGNTAPQRLLCEQPYMEKYYEVTTGAESAASSVYNVVKCETCGEVLLYSELDVAPDPDGFGTLLYPKLPGLNDAVPESVRHVYYEATRVKNISPLAFAILSRRVLEEICKERGVLVGNLAKSLRLLTESGALPPVFSESSDLVRHIGNAGAHASGIRISALEVLSVDDLLLAIIEYLYIAPSRVEKFRSRLAQLKSSVGE